MEEDNKTAAEYQEEYYQQTEEAMGQFMFLFYIPNSQTRTVEVYIDDGTFHTFYSFDEFFAKIESTCGKEEADKIQDSCRNLGVPYRYNRTYKTIDQIGARSGEERMSVKQIKSLSGFGKPSQNPWSVDNMYQMVKDNYNNIIKSIMNNEVNNGN